MKKIHFTDRYLLNPRHPVTVFVIGAGERYSSSEPEVPAHK